MEDVFVAAVVFGGIYYLIKVFTDFLLKRKIINSGHIDKAGIMEPPQNREVNSYPTLKWGLVTLFAGLGLLVIALISNGESFDRIRPAGAFLQFGIELIAISLGFLVYFIIARSTKK
jgi:hypothetical protein